MNKNIKNKEKENEEILFESIKTSNKISFEKSLEILKAKSLDFLDNKKMNSNNFK